MAAVWVLTKARYEAGPTRRASSHWWGRSDQVRVDLLPQLDGDHVAHGPGVLPGGVEGAGDRRAALGVAGQSLGDLPEDGLVAVGRLPHDRQQALGRGVGLGPALLERLVDDDVEDAGGPLGPFDVAPDPEDRLGNPAEEGVAHCCWACSASTGGPSSMGGPTSIGRGGSGRAGDGETGGRRRPPCRGTGLAHDPGVLRATALAGVDDEPALLEGDPGEPPGKDPDPLPVVDGEGSQVDVAWGHGPADPAGSGGERHHALGHPVTRRALDLGRQLVQLGSGGVGADHQPLAARSRRRA